MKNFTVVAQFCPFCCSTPTYLEYWWILKVHNAYEPAKAGFAEKKLEVLKDRAKRQQLEYAYAYSRGMCLWKCWFLLSYLGWGACLLWLKTYKIKFIDLN